MPEMVTLPVAGWGSGPAPGGSAQGPGGCSISQTVAVCVAALTVPEPLSYMLVKRPQSCLVPKMSEEGAASLAAQLLPSALAIFPTYS